MLKFIAKLVVFIEDIDGATAIEYGLIAGGISLAIVAVIFALGSDVNSVFTGAGTALQTVNNTAAANAGG